MNELIKDRAETKGESQHADEYAHVLRLRAATVDAYRTEEKIRTAQTRQIEETLVRLNDNMRLAQASLDALTVVTPAAGQLTALDATVGQTKAPQATLGQIDTRDRFRLIANVDEFHLHRVTIDQDALLTVEERDIHARVAKIYPQVTAGAFRVDLYFEDAPPSGLRSGQTVDLKVQLGGTRKAVILPNGPFYQETGGHWVFVVAANGRSASRRDVQLGRRNPQNLEVQDGVRPGERVITSSYQGFAKVNRLTLLRPGAQPD